MSISGMSTPSLNRSTVNTALSVQGPGVWVPFSGVLLTTASMWLTMSACDPTAMPNTSATPSAVSIRLNTSAAARDTECSLSMSAAESSVAGSLASKRNMDTSQLTTRCRRRGFRWHGSGPCRGRWPRDSQVMVVVVGPVAGTPGLATEHVEGAVPVLD